MKFIKITADNRISVIDFPEGSTIYINRCLREEIGHHCEVYELIRPRRLYTSLKASSECTRVLGSAACLLCDTDSRYHNLPVNEVASFLNAADRGGRNICGDVLIVGIFRVGRKETGISGLSSRQFNLLYPQLKDLTNEFKEKELEISK